MNHKWNNQSGVSMIETVIVFPIVIMIALWVIHIGLVYQARANLEYAALMGARIGALTHVDLTQMRSEIATRMAASQVGNEIVQPDQISITILNPTAQMFRDCGVIPLGAVVCDGGVGTCELPNFGLQFRPTAPVCDGVSIQDANILRVRVSYNFDSKIPFMSIRLFATDDGNRYQAGTTISAVATVRMQTSAQLIGANAAAYL